jgi:polyisoprenoid-binding protein YceI
LKHPTNTSKAKQSPVERENKERTMGPNFKKLAVIASILAAASSPAKAATSTWRIDSRHSDAQFAITHLMISTVRGEFHGINGTVVLDDQNIANSSVDVTIDATTVDTREPDRDKHLRSQDFFYVEKFPTMTFKSTKVEDAGSGKLKVTGDLTIRGTTKQIVLDVTAPKPPIKDPWGMQRSAVSATTKINRLDYGVSWNKTLDSGGVTLGDQVDITLDVEMSIPAAGK